MIMAKSSDVLIEFDHVYKEYRSVARLIEQEAPAKQGESKRCEERSPRQSGFSALQDVTFSICRGETIGIIGNNGAGKSTLLKLMAGITGPTNGRVAVSGRVSSLIELGAGFNPELTGRENIYLNGAVLGMLRRDIDASMEAIIRFARVGEFLDRPIKYYSSGMYARLGFAIAANANADIMLTDEILAVGDAAFQRQCIQRFRELQRSSTIVVVSHDLAKVKEVCSRVLWINEGRLECDGNPDEVVDVYLRSVQKGREATGYNRTACQDSQERRQGSGEIEILDVTTYDGNHRPRTIFKPGDDLTVRITFEVKAVLPDQGFGVKVLSSDGAFVHGTNTFLNGMVVRVEQGVGVIDLVYRRLPLGAGSYWLTVGATANNDWSAPHDLRECVCGFDVISARQDGGLVCLEHQWSSHASVR